MGIIEDVKAKLQIKSEEIDHYLDSPKNNRNEERNNHPNIIKRKLYSDIEIIRLDLLDYIAQNPSSISVLESEFGGFMKQIDILGKRLELQGLHRETKWWHPLDYSFRCLGIVLSIITIGLVFALPMILFRPLDDYLTRKGFIDPSNQISEIIKRFVCRFCMTLTGISVVTQGLEYKVFEGSVLLTFGHASNVDGYLVSMTCPVRHYALAKKELFLVPIFSWIAFAMGGIPLDRGNRERAVTTLQRSTKKASNEGVCVVIAPEGTRSRSGQLQQFKKGAFYITEQLQCPVVPFVAIGAFDIYPVDNYVNMPGRVYVRYLKPIYPSEATDRDHMGRLVRRRMLETFYDCPADLGADITWSERFDSLCCNMGVIAFDALVVRVVGYVFVERLGMTTQEVLLGFISGVVLITLSLYLYFVYVVNWISSFDRSDASKHK